MIYYFVYAFVSLLTNEVISKLVKSTVNTFSLS